MQMLSEGQQKALDLIKEGHNVFITGEAGSGKSFLVKEVLPNEVFGIFRTASTGISAINIKGNTIHSLCGLRPTTKTHLEAIRNMNDYQRMQLRGLKRILIDEISMISKKNL